MRNNETRYYADMFHHFDKYLDFEKVYRRLRKRVTTKAHYRKEDGTWSVYENKESESPLVIGCASGSLAHLQFTRYLRRKRMLGGWFSKGTKNTVHR